MTGAREVRYCPACSSGKHAQVGGEATAFPCDSGPDWPSHPPYAIRECRDCGLYFKSRTPTLEVLGRYYETLDFRPFSFDYRFPTDSHTLALLRRLPLGSRILDYGCSSGRLLGVLGASYERFGIEVNPDAATLALQKGIAIISEEDLVAGRQGLFDAILVTDVFEHLFEPTKTLSLLATRLNPGGHLVLVTGLADAVSDRDWIGEHWYFRIYGHLQMMSEKHFDWLCRELKLESGRRVRCSHYEHSLTRYARQLVQSMSYRTFKRSPNSV